MPDTAAALTEPLPGNAFYRRMAAGHLIRTGHELTAVLVSDDGGQLWRVQRSCCTD